jgi:replicative DNA helicase
MYAPGHAAILDAMRELTASGQRVDAVTVQAQLKRGGRLDQAGGTDYLFALPYFAPSPSGAPHYARIVKDAADLRRIADESYRAYERAYAGADPADDVLRDAADAMLAIARDRAGGAGAVPDPARLAAQFRRAVGEEIESVPTPFGWLDGMTGGLMPGNLVTIAGRTSAGKSAMALQIAKKTGRNRLTLYLSLEMPPQELLARYIASETDIAQRDIMLHRIPDGQREALDAALAGYERSRLHFSAAGRHIADIGRVVAAHRPQVLIIDTVNLVMSAGETERVKILNVTRELKQLALAEDIPVVILAQLSRGTDQKTSPMLSDIKESASIEEDSDIVLLLSEIPSLAKLEEIAKEGAGEPVVSPDTFRRIRSEGARTVLASIRKNRNGRLGRTALRFDAKRFTFSEIDEEETGIQEEWDHGRSDLPF